MILEFVGGPLCGQTHTVNLLPAEYDAAYLVGDLQQEWRVMYKRTGMTMQKSRNYRYVFAGQRLADRS